MNQNLINKTVTHKDNCFDFIRLFAALQVLFLHAVKHLDLAMPGLIKFVVEQFPGVYILFFIAGFFNCLSVIKKSDDNKKWKKQYLTNRFFRLYPSLVFSVIISLITILVFSSIIIDYFKLGIWFVGQSTFFQFYTPDFLRDYATGTPNGSLWTISVEIQFYLILVLFTYSLKKMNFVHFMCLMIASVLLNVLLGYFDPYLPSIISKIIGVTIIPYLFAFILGIIFAKYFNYFVTKIKLINCIFIPLFLCYSIIKYFCGISLGYYSDCIGGLLLCILTFSVGYSFKTSRFKYELSYGIYLFHMIIINVFVELRVFQDWFGFVLVLLITFVFAFVCDYIDKAIHALRNYRNSLVAK